MKKLEQEYYLIFKDTTNNKVVTMSVDKNSLNGDYMFSFSENAKEYSDLWLHVNYGTKRDVKRRIKGIKEDSKLIVISEEIPQNKKSLKIT